MVCANGLEDEIWIYKIFIITEDTDYKVLGAQ